METEESTLEFAQNHSFGCAHMEGDTAYVHGVYGTGGGNRFDILFPIIALRYHMYSEVSVDLLL